MPKKTPTTGNGNTRWRKSNTGKNTKAYKIFFARANTEVDSLFKRFRNEFRGLFPNSERTGPGGFGKHLHELVGKPEADLRQLYASLLLSGDETRLGNLASTFYDFIETLDRKIREQKAANRNK